MPDVAEIAGPIPVAVLEACRERLRVRVGYQLRMARIDKGYSIAELAKRCGRKSRTIHDLERGDLLDADLNLMAEVAIAMGLEWQFHVTPAQGMEARQGGDEGSVHDSPVHAPETGLENSRVTD